LVLKKEIIFFTLTIWIKIHLIFFVILIFNQLMSPLVSIVALSYNHAPYITEALDSILTQTYKNIEIIVVDDASTDNSVEVISKFIEGSPSIQFIPLKENIGNCRAFNLGYTLAKGKYIVDFALDDVLLPTRIEKQVEIFESLPMDYGVVFSDVGFIDQKGKPLGAQYKRDKGGKLLDTVPSGDVYKDLLEKYFISPPSMISRREVFEQLGGYDETLAYEDFDFWVRSSRYYKYHFIDEIQTLKRVLPNSHGSKFSLKREYKMLESTLKVCEKAYRLNKNQDENEALAKRIRYHLRQAFFTENFSVVMGFHNLLRKTAQLKVSDNLWGLGARLKVPTHWLYKHFR
jgi:glycosyltransferase involved in cell wall biosynthesis